MNAYMLYYATGVIMIPVLLFLFMSNQGEAGFPSVQQRATPCAA